MDDKATGSQPVTEAVMVATFTGTHKCLRSDLRPYPERMDERVSALEAQLALVRQEVAALQIQVSLSVDA